MLDSTFAGSRYDIQSNVQVVLVTDLAAESLVRDLAVEHNIAVSLELAEFSYEDLTIVAERIASGDDPVLSPLTRMAYANDDNNTVDVYVPPVELAGLRRHDPKFILRSGYWRRKSTLV